MSFYYVNVFDEDPVIISSNALYWLASCPASLSLLFIPFRVRWGSKWTLWGEVVDLVLPESTHQSGSLSSHIWRVELLDCVRMSLMVFGWGCAV
ncbi:hypothetical protein [Pectobacterium odoriferum]|uniref:hypothetical protein n=1 Tax=Pectobacterium odoriferum TaxID=78398 RepID=UPI0011AEFEDC|nr:hypothetical protein [Pectobacterium odoriferum]